MSLNIRIKEGDENKKASQNIEGLFSSINLTGNAKEKRVIELIEKGKYNDSASFIIQLAKPRTFRFEGCQPAYSET